MKKPLGIVLLSPEFTLEEKLFLVAVLAGHNRMKDLTLVSRNLTPLLTLLGKGWLAKAKNGRIVPGSKLKELLPSKEPPDPAVARLLSLYSEEYETRFGRPPVIRWAADGNQFKTLLRGTDEKTLAVALRAFLADDDPFLRKAGHSLSAFFSRINGYLTVAEKEPRAEDDYSGERVI